MTNIHSQLQALWRVRADRPNGSWDERAIWAPDGGTAIETAAKERGWYAATTIEASRISDWRQRIVRLKRDRLPKKPFGLSILYKSR